MKNRKNRVWVAAACIAAMLAGCGTGTVETTTALETETVAATEAESETEAAITSGTEAASTESTAQAESQGSTDGSNILIAYFSVPEAVDTSGVDAIAGASIVVKDDQVLGNTEYVADLIQQTIGGNLFRIESVDSYPLDHDPLVDQAAEEQKAGARPELASHIENLDQYDTILIGYPNWWGDMPMPLYTFLKEYDFSGKVIIPFCTHGGSGLSGTVNTISELQPGARVQNNSLVISRNDVADCADSVFAWAEALKEGLK